MRNRRNVRKNNRAIEILTNRVFVITSSILLLIIFIFLGIICYRKYSDNKLLAEQKQKFEQETEDIFSTIDQTINNKQQSSTATLSAVGDILCEDELIQDAKNGEDYNFNPMFADILKYTQSSNMTIGTLETNFTDNSYSGYGKYNSPKQFLQTIKDTGIDLVSVAHNHELDYGKQGLDTTLQRVKDVGLSVTGTKDNPENQDKEFTGNIKEINGIKIAYLAYTYGLSNEDSITEEEKQNANIYTEEKASKDIEYAKQNSNYIIVIMHWGDVYNTNINDWQNQVSNFLIENGVDMILGSHPSTIEPMKIVQNKDNKNVLIAYSLGNYISSLQSDYSDVELILNMQIVKKDGQDKASLQKVNYTPVCVMDNGKNAENRFKLVDMKQLVLDYTNGKKDEITRDTYNKLVEKLNWLENIIKEGNK